MQAAGEQFVRTPARSASLFAGAMTSSTSYLLRERLHGTWLTRPMGVLSRLGVLKSLISFVWALVAPGSKLACASILSPLLLLLFALTFAPFNSDV